jgi:hypothetical protein
MGEMRNAYKVLVGKPEGKRPFERDTRTWEHNTRMNLKINRVEGVDWINLTKGTGGSFPGVKRPGREADHSPPSIAEVKNAWSYTFTPPIRLHGVVLS